MFVLATQPLEWPVTVRLPVSGGDFADYQFTGIFARLPWAEVDALAGFEVMKKAFDDARDAKDVAALNRLNKEILDRQAENVPALLIGWKDVRESEGGGEVPFAPLLLQAQLTGPNRDALTLGVWTAVGEIRNGNRPKNSAPSPVIGQPSEPVEAAGG